MPEHGGKTGHDTLSAILARLQRLEDARPNKRTTWDRGDHNKISSPVEGQVIVQYDTEEVWYFSNGQWRRLGGGSSGLDFSMRTIWGWPLSQAQTNLGAEVENENSGHYWTPVFDSSFALGADAGGMPFGWYLENTDTDADVIFPFWMPGTGLTVVIWPLRADDGGLYRVEVATWDYDALSVAAFDWHQIPFAAFGLMDCSAAAATPLESQAPYAFALYTQNNAVITRGDDFDTVTIAGVPSQVWNGSPGPMALRVIFDQVGQNGGSKGWIGAISFAAGNGTGVGNNYNGSFVMHDQP